MDADGQLVEREVARLKARGTDQDLAIAALLADVPTGVAATFIRDGMLRALGGQMPGEYWLRIQELNFLAHRKRRAERRRYAGPVYSLMAVLPDE